MKTHRLLLALTFLFTLAGLEAEDKKEDFKPLFNGKDLTGWQGMGGPMTNWEVKEGVLSCTGKGGSFHDSAGQPMINTSLFPSMAAMVEHGHAQEHVSVRIPRIPTDTIGSHLRDALYPPLGRAQIVQWEIEGHVRVRVRAIDRDEPELEWPLLAGLVDGQNVGDLVGEDILHPVVITSNLPI